MVNVDKYLSADNGYSVVDDEHLNHDLYDEIVKSTMPEMIANKYKVNDKKQEKDKTEDTSWKNRKIDTIGGQKVVNKG